MSSFGLKLGDYFAIAGLVVAAVGTIYLIDKANADASEARIMGEIRLSSQAALTGQESLTEKFSALSLGVKATVERGLEKRTDEVLLSMTRLENRNAGITVRISNIPSDSKHYSDFKDFALEQGSDASFLDIGGKAIGDVKLTNFDGQKALALKALMGDIAASGYNDIDVKYLLTDAASFKDRDFTLKLLQQEISILEEEVARITLENRD